MNLPDKLKQELTNRKQSNALRKLQNSSNLIDFYSNDYLGFANSESILKKTYQLLTERNLKINGATGSRLISGNHKLYEETEELIADFHNSEKALIFNSGYDANVGFLSSVLRREDIILYDELSHASIRDGIELSKARSYKFKHNDLTHLKHQIVSIQSKLRTQESVIYIVTESVFSMDGNSPDLIALTKISKTHKTYLIIDEAHAFGVFGNKGEGFVQQLRLENSVFARIITYGKSLGCHGAAILGGEQLYQYLINFSRSFIYTTGLPPHSIATIQIAYQHLQSEIVKDLREKIVYFTNEKKRLKLDAFFIKSNSAIHCCVTSGVVKTKEIAENLQGKGFNIKAILSPAVPKGKERLRICLHRFNSEQEITHILEELAILIK